MAPPPNNNNIIDIVHDVKKYIEKNPCMIIKTTKLAEDFDISKNKLMSIFRNEYQTTISKWADQIKLKYLKKLIREDNSRDGKTAHCFAKDVGYSSGSGLTDFIWRVEKKSFVLFVKETKSTFNNAHESVQQRMLQRMYV